MSIIKKNEVGAITCEACKTVFNLASKESKAPITLGAEGITCTECIELINNIELDGTLQIIQILKSDK